MIDDDAYSDNKGYRRTCNLPLT